jgi:PAS domain S-box-containing protein
MESLDVRVLCVDDQQEATSLLQRQLSGTFDCTVVQSAKLALEALENSGPFAVVVSDYVMPETNGVELFQEVKQRWPDSVRVMVTALDELDVAIAALHDGSVYRFVRKPWRADEIVHAVSEAADYFRLVQNERKLRDELARTNAALDEKVQDLDEANELLEYWVEFSPAVLYSFSLEQSTLRASYISKNFSRLTGYERTAAVIDADFWPNLINLDDLPRYQDLSAELVGGELSHAVIEYRIAHKGGAEIAILDSLRAVHDGDGQTIEVVGAWIDVSARR